jgi:hypothetical protein
MKRWLFICFFPLVVTAQLTGNETPNYVDLIARYKQLDKENDEIVLLTIGKSDCDFPLYVCIINGGIDSSAIAQSIQSKTVMLINNAIHPGEPDGVNASLIWIEQWLKNGKPLKNLPVIAIVPAYNVGGMLQRGPHSRANQNGPANYGFRANAQNLDLNRDFIKMDSENAKTFVRLYNWLNPDVFVDTHVSNGADYQYTLTLITSMKERMSETMRNLTYQKCLPEMTIQLKKKGWDWSPYVETKEEVPESGICAFNDLPRYAMGFASLNHALSFTVETHMLKPFPNRVKATTDFLSFLIQWTGKNSDLIEQTRAISIQESIKNNQYFMNYQLSEKADSILFKGYQHDYRPSNVTTGTRLFYDRTKPFEKNIPFFNDYQSFDSVKIPEAYIVSAEATAIIERLQLNGIEMKRLEQTDTMVVNTQRILRYQSPSNPYEGHYIHSETTSMEQLDTIRIPKGSYFISTQQAKRNFILAVLEPRCEDSYFSWGFMDSYVQEKEYFSAYVFEDLAVSILENDPQLAEAFEQKKRNDLTFATDAKAQLFYIYRHSSYFEKATFNRLPVYKCY